MKLREGKKKLTDMGEGPLHAYTKLMKAQPQEELQNAPGRKASQ